MYKNRGWYGIFFDPANILVPLLYIKISHWTSVPHTISISVDSERIIDATAAPQNGISLRFRQTKTFVRFRVHDWIVFLPNRFPLPSYFHRILCSVPTPRLDSVLLRSTESMFSPVPCLWQDSVPANSFSCFVAFSWTSFFVPFRLHSRGPFRHASATLLSKLFFLFGSASTAR